MNSNYPSRTADKFVVRLPDGLRDSVQGAADYLDTSMNTVFVQAVRQYLDTQKRQQLLLDALAKAVTGKEELDAVLHWRGKHTQAIRERDALQQLLNAKDELADLLGSRLEECITEMSLALEDHAVRSAMTVIGRTRFLELVKAHHAALQPAETQQCQFPQSCPGNCGCDIPDFTPGNGNKARRRAAAIEALKPENQRIVPCNTDQSPDYFKCLKVD